MTCKFCNNFAEGWNEGQADGHKEGYQFGFAKGLEEGKKNAASLELHDFATKVFSLAQAMRHRGEDLHFWALLGVTEDLCQPHLADDDDDEGLPL